LGVSAGVRQLLAPRLLALHALATLATVAALLLGLWQYDAWKASRDDEAATRTHAEPKPLNSVLASDERFPGDAVGQPVRLSGRWLPASTVYVADRELDGRRGLWAVTPVEVCPAGQNATRCAGAPAILVVRGWVPTVRDAPAPPTGPVEVTGWLQPGEGSGTTDPDPSDDVILEVRLADAIQHVDQDLYGGYVIAQRTSADPPTGLRPVTPASLPKPDTFTALRNLLYALEWWVFGGFAAFIWWRWCRDELQRQRDGEEATDAEVSGVTGVPSAP
jgi:surfeit locus 1 family protein